MNSKNYRSLVSIIMPSYNSSKTIEVSIDSVLAQSYSNWELLITDDSSSDNTVEIIESYKDPRIRLYRHDSNQGTGAARNNSIRIAKGEYIAFLDSDDLWLPEKLAKQISFMQTNGYKFTYSHYQKFDSKGERGIVYSPPSVTYDQLIYSNVIGCLTVIYDVKLLGKHYMPEIRKRQDMGLWLKLLKICGKAYALEEVLAKYKSDSGMTSNKLSMLAWQWKFYRDIAGLSRRRALYVFMIYCIYGVKKFVI